MHKFHIFELSGDRHIKFDLKCINRMFCTVRVYVRILRRTLNATVSFNPGVNLWLSKSRKTSRYMPWSAYSCIFMWYRIHCILFMLNGPT